VCTDRASYQRFVVSAEGRCYMKTRKNRVSKKKRQVRDLPKRKKALTEAQANSVKGGGKMSSGDGAILFPVF
jgi:hypothetical protein